MVQNIDIPENEISTFCHKWTIKELSVFGSVLGDDFRADSDIDVLVVFDDNAEWSLFDLGTMSDELQTIFKRQVDLVEKDGLKNPYRRHAILNNREVIYAS